MAPNRKTKAKKKKALGNPNWKKGGKSPNPTGLPREVRERRRQVRELLDEAFHGKGTDGCDLFVEHLVRGVEKLDSTCLKLVADHRWGKPKQVLEVETPTAFEFFIGKQ